ncbi:MAG TPA: peptidylprolyl isomerase [Egibacteraceae bacterium]|nr:peptidylprolyl isomerase [Egibacteraceae bacterium]
MRPATTSRRAQAPLALLTAVVALLAAACAGAANTADPSTAAVVDGTAIPLTAVETLFVSAKANPQVAQQLQGDGARRVQAQILSDLVRARLLELAAGEQLGITVDEADVDAKRAEVVEQLGGQEAFDEIVAQNRLSPQDLDAQLRSLAYQELVAERLTRDLRVPREEIRQAYEREYAGNSPRVRHILVETEEQARDALRRVRAGEDFAAVASEVSGDPGSAQRGGELGAIRRGATVPEFEEAVFGARPGEVVGPVRTQFGFHVIEVLEAPPLEAVEDDLRAQLLEQRQAEVLRDWLAERARQARVRVNPRFGVWNPEAGRVDPVDPLGGVTEVPQAPEDATGSPGEPVEEES